MNKKTERRFLPAQELRVQQSDGRRKITGYAAVHNKPSQDLGDFTEIIAPGAFSDAVTAGSDVLCLRDHDPKILLGRTKARTLVLAEDHIGLRSTCDLPNTSQAEDLTESIRRGDLDGVSFGFRALKDD